MRWWCAVIRDICPIHGEPMWYWLAGDEYVCQRPQCEAKNPTTAVAYEARRNEYAMDALRYSMRSMYRMGHVTTPPRSAFFVTGV
jgi:hypothetical protein